MKLNKLIIISSLSLISISAIGQDSHKSTSNNDTKIIEQSSYNNRGDKILSMHDVILGYNLSPRVKFTVWQGETHSLVQFDKDKLIKIDAKTGKKETLTSLQAISNALKLKKPLRLWSPIQFEDSHTMTMKSGRNLNVFNLTPSGITLNYKISTPSKSTNQHFSNSAKAIAYTIDNNLYISDFKGNKTAVTSYKDKNLICGQSVSRNEFGITKGIFWSPDGSKLGFYKKDVTNVTDFPLFDITTRTGTSRMIKYPMAGTPSEHVTFGIYDRTLARTIYLKVTDFDQERYITNLTWSPDSKYIYAQILNRGQNEMHLNKYDANNGDFIKTILTEKDDRYEEPMTPIVFMKNDPTKFIYSTNNRDGYYNLYLISNDDVNTIKRITPVDADVAFVGEDGKYVYYTSAEVSPIEQHYFKINIKKVCSLSKKEASKSNIAERLTPAEGWHNIIPSADMKYFLDNYSSLNVPAVLDLRDANKNKDIRELDRATCPDQEYNYGQITLGTVKSADGLYDNYYRLTKPANFDPSKKYPMILYVYGGPHSQLVKDTYLGSQRRWEMYMAQKGYVVFVMDNRGTLNRGADFEKIIHGQCGQAEMADQMVGVRMMMDKPWVDTTRIGVHGWSYGGFMTISLLTNYPSVFKVAVAGGPVIDWKWYEVMYGERYMDTPQENPKGYAKVSLINQAKNVKGKLLVIQGLIDNTVVRENSYSFIRECIKNQVPVDYFIYPRAEHNVRGVDRIHLMNKVSQYFEDYLK